MIGELLKYLTPVYVGVFVLVVAIVQQVVIRSWYERKVRAAGGVHAPVLARDPLTGQSLNVSSIYFFCAQTSNGDFILSNQYYRPALEHLSVLLHELL